MCQSYDKLYVKYIYICIYNFNVSTCVGLLHEIKMCLNETYSKELIENISEGGIERNRV